MSRLKIIDLSDSLRAEGYYITMYIEDGKLIVKMENPSKTKNSNAEISLQDLDSDNTIIKNKLKDKVK